MSIQLGKLDILLGYNQEVLVDTNKELFVEFLGQIGTEKVTSGSAPSKEIVA